MEYKNLMKRAKLANHDYVLTKTELDFFVSSKYKFHEPILTSHEIKKKCIQNPVKGNCILASPPLGSS